MSPGFGRRTRSWARSDVARGLKRWALAACLAGVACLAAGQVKLSVSMSGRVVGEASLTQSLLPDGGKRVQLALQLVGGDGRKVSVRAESTYDAHGAPTRKFLESTSEKPRSRRQIVATFDAEGARVVEDRDGKRTVRQVVLVKAAPRENPSEFWFLREAPKAGATVKYYRFDMDTLTWVLTSVRYSGPKSQTVAGRRVSGHEIVDDRATTLVDSNGLPWIMEMPGVRFERKP